MNIVIQKLYLHLGLFPYNGFLGMDLQVKEKCVLKTSEIHYQNAFYKGLSMQTF